MSINRIGQNIKYIKIKWHCLCEDTIVVPEWVSELRFQAIVYNRGMKCRDHIIMDILHDRNLV